MIAAAYALALTGLATLMLVVPIAHAKATNGPVMNEADEVILLAGRRGGHRVGHRGSRRHGARHGFRHRGGMHRTRARHHFRHSGMRHVRHHRTGRHYRHGFRHGFRHSGYRYGYRHHGFPSFYFSLFPGQYSHGYSHYPYYYDFPRYYRYSNVHQDHGRYWKNARSGKVPYGAVVSHYRHGNTVYGCKVMYRKAWRYGHVGRKGCNIRHSNHPVVLKHYKVLVRRM